MPSGWFVPGCRALLAALALVIATPGWLLSQGGWTVAARVGHLQASDLFRHEVRVEPVPGVTYTSLRTLEVQPAVTLGGRAEYRSAGGWLAGVDVARGRSDFVFGAWQASDGGTASEEIRGESTVTSVGVTLGRSHQVAPRLTAVIAVGGWYLRHSLDLPALAPCPPATWAEYCEPTQPWPMARRYDVPSVGGGLGVRFAATRRLELTLDGAASAGRTDTSTFYEDLLPEFDDLEAPRSFGVNTLQAALGLAFRL